jgi:hypothetical protein
MSIFNISKFGNKLPAYTTWTFDEFSLSDDLAAMAPETEFQSAVNPMAVVLHCKNNGVYIDDAKVFSQIVPSVEEHRLADEILTHYREKLAVQKLSGTFSPTSYRKDLAKALQQCDQGVVEQSKIPILITLDSFYKEDKAIETLVEDFRSIDPRADFPDLLKAKPLTHVKTVQVHRSGNKKSKYFFADAERFLYSVDIPRASTAVVAVDALFALHSNFHISGTARISQFNDHDFSYVQVSTLTEMLPV